MTLTDHLPGDCPDCGGVGYIAPDNTGRLGDETMKMICLNCGEPYYTL